MIPELGHFALVLALLVAIVQSTLPMTGAAIGSPRLMALARPAARTQALLVAFAFGCLAWSFISNDFSVQNVASNSNSELPLRYRFAATWGSHEGSLLLWTLMARIRSARNPIRKVQQAARTFRTPAEVATRRNGHSSRPASTASCDTKATWRRLAATTAIVRIASSGTTSRRFRHR